MVKDNEKLLTGGIWCMITVNYFFEEGQKTSPFSLMTLKPIQMPNMDMEEVFDARKHFNRDQWIDVLLRSVGMEPANIEQRTKWHLITRMIRSWRTTITFASWGRVAQVKAMCIKSVLLTPVSFRRANDRCQLVLQHGQSPDRPGWHVGCGSVRRSRGDHFQR